MIIKRTKDIKIFNSLNKIYHIKEQISKVSREKIKELELKVQQLENCCLQGCFIEKKV